jgi:hypothetical protein
MNSVSRIDQCKRTFCVPREKEKRKESFRSLQKRQKDSLKNIMKQLKNKNVPVDEREELQRQSKLLVASLKKKHTMEENTRLMDDCMTSFCNPSCVGTLLAKGKKFPLLSTSRRLFLESNKHLIKFEKRTRKKIFGSKSNVLRSDDFYEKMSEKDIQTKKKKGAISGCDALYEEHKRNKIWS